MFFSNEFDGFKNSEQVKKKYLLIIINSKKLNFY